MVVVLVAIVIGRMGDGESEREGKRKQKEHDKEWQ
jgi:hypothetical protein